MGVELPQHLFPLVIDAVCRKIEDKLGGTKNEYYEREFGFIMCAAKGTGRFQEVKGTLAAKGKHLPVKKGEAGPKAYGEVTVNYTPLLNLTRLVSSSIGPDI
jgi:hypothetical protein